MIVPTLFFYSLNLSQELAVTELERIAEYKFLKLNNIDLSDANILQRIDPQTGMLDAAFVGNRSTVTAAIDYAHKSISSDRFPLSA